jgi:hypothetical protein
LKDLRAPEGPGPGTGSGRARLMGFVRAERAWLLAFVGSRLIVLAAAVLVSAGLVPVNPRLLPHGTEPSPMALLTAWDGRYFLGIAAEGYHPDPVEGIYRDQAFFPLYPLAVRSAALGRRELMPAAALLVNEATFLAGLLLLVRLGERVVGPARARRGAALYALLPFSFVYSMAYSEGLFLAAILAAFLAAEGGRAARAGGAYAVAAITRLQGAIYLLPLLLASRLAPPRLRWLALLAGPAAGLAYLGWVALQTGDPMGYFVVSGAWRTSVVVHGGGTGTMLDALSGPLGVYLAALMTCLVASVGLLVFVRVDRIPPAYVLVPLLSLATLFATRNLESIGRIVLLSFPYAWILASRSHPAWRYGWPILSAALLFGLSVATFAGAWVP